MSKSPKTQSVPQALHQFDLLPNSANVRQPVVDGLFNWSPATTWRRVKAGDIPAPHKVGRTTFWNVGQLRACLSKCLGGSK